LRAADAAGAYRIAAGALAEGMPLARLYQRVITPAMYGLGELWEKGAITIADEHLATALTHRVLVALRRPAFVPPASEGEPSKPRAMLATVPGEQHALGLRMAADLIEDAGYRTLYLGADVPAGSLRQAIETLSPDLLALSATMPKSGSALETVVAEVRAEHPRLDLVVGGQATASHRVREATPIEDLERLDERVRPPE
jgi:methanogenic corrinoid protein MtbC1